MRTTALPLPDGRWLVPGNRWNLVPDTRVEPEPVEISVVVPYFEDPAGLDRLLGALDLQTHPRSRFEVVIADDGSASPPVPDSRWASALTIKTVRQPDRGFRAAAARNLGAAHADGRVLAFLDGDTIPEPEYLTRISRLPAVLPDALVGGRRRHVDLGTWSTAAVLDWLRGAAGQPAEFPEPRWLADEYKRSANLLRTHPRSYRYLISATLACDRELFADIGGFDATMTGYGGEDWDLAYRAYHRAGAVFAHEPAATVWHDGPDWAGRAADDATRRRTKNREILELARRVSEPTMRGEGGQYERTDCVVRVDIDGASIGAVVLSTRSWLDCLDCRVELVGAEAESLVELLGDARISTPRGPGFPGRALISVAAPLVADQTTAALVLDMLEQEVGVMVMGQGEATVLASRAAGRARRWSAAVGVAADDLIEQLFPVRHVSGPRTGLARVLGDPSLAAVFGGWADPAGYLRSLE